MVYESYPWKLDLMKRKRLIIKHNTAEKFDQKFDSTYTIIEKCVFYSAFIIRKLIDSRGKLSDEADRYTIKVKSIRPIKSMDLLHRWPDESSHDWEKAQRLTVTGKDICNWLIHSYIFFFVFDENGTVINFCVSSDYDRNKALYMISISDWITYMDYIFKDDVVSMSSHYDDKAKDYVYIRKKRGVR
jgi:hypothetical protein